MEPEAFGKAFQEAIDKGTTESVRWDSENGVILLLHFLAYNPPENPNVVKSWEALVDEIPEASSLISDWIPIAKDSLKGKDKSFHDTFDKAFPKAFREGLSLPNPIPNPIPKAGGTRAPAPDYTITHPAIEPDPIEPQVDLTWVVQDAYRGQYAEKYGHRGKWNEPGHGDKARGLVEYFREVAEAKGVEFTPDLLARGVKNATKRYIQDDDEFVSKPCHPFDLFVARIDRYVGRQVKR